jgi:hypothetical protein
MVHRNEEIVNFFATAIEVLFKCERGREEEGRGHE